MAAKRMDFAANKMLSISSASSLEELDSFVLEGSADSSSCGLGFSMLALIQLLEKEFFFLGAFKEVDFD